MRRAIRAIAGLILILAALTACDPGPPATAPTAGLAAPPATTRTYDPAHTESGPHDPPVGQWYPFDLYAHCTGEYTIFGGLWWQTATPPGDQQPTADAQGNFTYNGYLAGWMARTSTDTALFAMGDARITYQRVATGPLCS